MLVKRIILASVLAKPSGVIHVFTDLEAARHMLNTIARAQWIGTVA